MKRIVSTLILLSAITAAAQQTPPVNAPTVTNPAASPTTLDQSNATIKSLKNENATLRIQISNLQMSLVQSEGRNVTEGRKTAIKELEGLNPGMHWDEARGGLLPNQAPATAKTSSSPAAAPKPAVPSAKPAVPATAPK